MKLEDQQAADIIRLLMLTGARSHRGALDDVESGGPRERRLD